MKACPILLIIVLKQVAYKMEKFDNQIIAMFLPLSFIYQLRLHVSIESLYQPFKHTQIARSIIFDISGLQTLSPFI